MKTHKFNVTEIITSVLLFVCSLFAFGCSDSENNKDNKYSKIGAVAYISSAVSFSLVSPENNATEISLKPTLTWIDAIGENGYIITVATDPQFVALTHVEYVGADTTMITLPFSLNINTNYYWRVSSIYLVTTSNLAPNSPFIFTTIIQIIK